MSYTTTLKHIIDLEDEVFIDTDASMHKATQENGEFQEALLSGDVHHIIDEAADAISNTLIATHRVIGEVPKEIDFFCTEVPVNLTISNYKRNDALQTYRGIYSRNTKTVSKEEILKRTNTHISGILGHAQAYKQDISVASALEHSLGKITGRMDLYKPRIDLKESIKSHDFKGVDFKDISPLLRDPEQSEYLDKQFAYRAREADVIVGLEARGFYFKSVATKLGIPFIPARKEGKLPGETLSVEYGKEYGTDALEIQLDAIKPGQKVVILDDLLATGGTAEAARKLIEQAGGIVIGNYFVIELDELNGREKLRGDTRSIVHY